MVVIFVGKEQKEQNEQLPKYPAFNITNTGQYIGRKHIFED